MDNTCGECATQVLEENAFEEMAEEAHGTTGYDVGMAMGGYREAAARGESYRINYVNWFYGLNFTQVESDFRPLWAFKKTAEFWSKILFDPRQCANGPGACILEIAAATPLGKGPKVMKGLDDIADAANTADNVAVIGRQWDTAVAKDWPGHEVADIPKWSIAKNDAWVNGVIERGQKVYIGSPETKANLWDSVNNRSTVFGRELSQFLDAGYTRSGDYLLPPG